MKFYYFLLFQVFIEGSKNLSEIVDEEESIGAKFDEDLDQSVLLAFTAGFHVPKFQNS